jgi:prepilin-type N-terminal cleavage/methylation domain-containing protein
LFRKAHNHPAGTGQTMWNMKTWHPARGERNPIGCLHRAGLPVSDLRTAAFTLIELLVVIAILAILAALLFVGFRAARGHVDRTVGISNIRHIAVAIQQFANDHDNQLPGPLWAGQGPLYNVDPKKLATQLWPYLDLPEPTLEMQEAKIMGSPAYYRERERDDSPSLFLNESVSLSNGIEVFPWGYQPPGAPNFRGPQKVVTIENPGSQWAMKDVDQTYPFATAPGWMNRLPKQPIYGDKRLTLYFDWSARFVPIE